MIKVMNAQFSKKPTKAMMVINMNSMSLKVIYFLKVFLGLLKDLGPKRDLNT
jgi:hypothetical protein